MTNGIELWDASAEEALRRLQSRLEGLAPDEVAARLRQNGPNVLPSRAGIAVLTMVSSQLWHGMAVLLWLAGALAFAARMPELGWAIWAVIVINGGFGFWQEYRAERALQELGRMLPARARVRRNGAVEELPASELVPGDVVELEEGDRLSADVRWLEGDRISMDLSILTGESTPVARHAEAAVMHGVAASEIPNLGLAGSTVVAGRGVAVVYETGARTEIGRVAALTAAIRREPSTLERQIKQTVRIVSILAVLCGAVVFVLAHALVGIGLRESFIFSIGIIVANVPEGLLPTVTLALALSVQRMAKRHALVRRLSAVETLGAVDVICTDKTGTLTQNEMTVRRLWVPSVPVEVTGTGFIPDGVLVLGDPVVRQQVHLLLAGVTLCSNARLVPPAGGGQWHVIGDPTEGALLVAAVKARLRPDVLHHDAPRLREVAFDSRRKMMTIVRRWESSTLWQTTATHLSFTKGAPREVLERCTMIVRGETLCEMTAADRAQAEAANDDLAAQGFRVLALAFREGDETLLHLSMAHLEEGLAFIGLTAMLDPPRAGVEQAVVACRAAGIRITMLTGDYGLTAEAVAAAIGLPAGRVVSGYELDAMTDEELLATVAAEDVIFARVTPEHKLRVVRAYQRGGHVVAVTGDGVNDAPALKAANIGVAMGVCGTDVAREAADVVLLDDNFATIVAAVEAGRAVYANIRKFLTYILASNVPEMIPFIAMLVFKIPPALNILQILAIDLGTDMVPAVALGGEPPEPTVMRQPPRPHDASLLDRSLLLRAYGFLGLIEAFACMCAFVGVWQLQGIGMEGMQLAASLLGGADCPPGTLAIFHASTTAALLAIIACQMGNLFACRSERASVSLFAARNRLLWVGLSVEAAAVMAIMGFPPLAALLGTAPIPAVLWAAMPLWPLLLLLLDALQKRLSAGAALTSG